MCKFSNEFSHILDIFFLKVYVVFANQIQTLRQNKRLQRHSTRLNANEYAMNILRIIANTRRVVKRYTHKNLLEIKTNTNSFRQDTGANKER